MKTATTLFITCTGKAFIGAVNPQLRAIVIPIQAPSVKAFEESPLPDFRLDDVTFLQEMIQLREGFGGYVRVYVEQGCTVPQAETTLRRLHAAGLCMSASDAMEVTR